jgi:tetratricopeptide (TPR) repeat protein
MVVLFVSLYPAILFSGVENISLENKGRVEEKKTAKDWYNIGISYSELGMHEEAIKSFKKAIGIEPDFAEAHLGLGISYFYLKDRSSALKEYDILKRLNPQLAKELFKLMHFYPQK